YVMRFFSLNQMPVTSMPAQVIYMRFPFHADIRRVAVIKGLEVGTVSVAQTGQKFLFPLHGGTLDLASLHAPDPRVLTLGPDALPAKAETWGWMKALYR